jgi:hypothetical protein
MADDQSKPKPPVQKRVPRVWDMKPDEPAKAYSAFMLYRSLGVGRKLADAAERLHVRVYVLEKLSQRFSWAFRADQWDAWALRQRSHSAEKRVLREAELEARTISDLVRMTRILTKRTMLNVIRTKAASLTPQGVATLADIVVKLSRLQRGEPTDRRENIARSARERVREKLDTVAKTLADQIKTKEKPGDAPPSKEVH